MFGAQGGPLIINIPPDESCGPSCHRFVISNCENRVVEVLKAIRSIDGTAVRCMADRCGEPAFFLFVAVGTASGRWAYEHADIRARKEKLQLPGRVRVAGALAYD
jgi:hypothetical protein